MFNFDVESDENTTWCILEGEVTYTACFEAETGRVLSNVDLDYWEVMAWF